MFLITCPAHDITTHYLSSWSKEIINVANNKGKIVVELLNKRAVKKDVEGILSKKPVKLVMFNGHGTKNCITGHQNQILIESPVNEKLLKSKIVYCRSCKSAKKLGPDSVISGSTAFIGYDDDFVFIYDPQKITKPLQDTVAKIFLEPTNTVVLSLLKGHTVVESYQKSQEQFKQKIGDLFTSETAEEDIHSLPFLIWDMQHQIYHGDGQATY